MAVVPTIPDTTSVETSISDATSTEIVGIDCNDGLDASGATCHGGPAANPNNGGVDTQSSAESESEVATCTDEDTVQN